MEFENSKLSEDKTLVENCIKLRVGNLPKKLLHQINRQDIDDIPPPIGEENKEGKKGKFIIKFGTIKLHCSFAIDLNTYPPVLKIEFTKNPSDLYGLSTQQIELEIRPITFGMRWYFTCRCGKLCNVLYLPLNNNFFACRECYNLTYESCRINKNTLNNLPYYTSRLIKLHEKRKQITHPIYKNKYTKRMNNLIKISEKWGVGIKDDIKEMATLKLILANEKNQQ